MPEKDKDVGESEKEVTADISIRGINKRAIAWVVSFLGLASAVPLGYMVNKPDISDRFYGEQGRELQHQYRRLSAIINEYGQALEAHKDAIEHIKRDDEDCVERQMRMESDIARALERAEKLHDKVHEFQARKSAVDEHQNMLINQCMRSVQ